MDARETKLLSIEARYNELSDLLISDEVVSNVKLTTKYSKEQASIRDWFEAYQEFKKLNELIDDAKTGIAAESDPELKKIDDAIDFMTKLETGEVKGYDPNEDISREKKSKSKKKK